MREQALDEAATADRPIDPVDPCSRLDRRAHQARGDDRHHRDRGRPAAAAGARSHGSHASYDLSDVEVTKKQPLTLGRFEAFFEAYPARADTDRSWTVAREEIEARRFDLKAVNPNARVEVDPRRRRSCSTRSRHAKPRSRPPSRSFASFCSRARKAFGQAERIEDLAVAGHAYGLARTREPEREGSLGRLLGNLGAGSFGQAEPPGRPRRGRTGLGAAVSG